MPTTSTVTAALTILLAAMTRERSAGGLVGLEHGVERDDEHAAGEGDADQVDHDPPAAGRGEERVDAGAARLRHEAAVDSHRSIMKAARSSAETGT